MWYPDTEKGGTPSVRGTLTRLDATEYRDVVHNWPIHDFIIWAEESRVMEKFKDFWEDT